MDGGNGNRTVVSDSNDDGPALANIQGLALDSYEDRAVLINNYTELVAVDMVSGERSSLTDWNNTKQGPSPSAIGDVVGDASAHRLVVAEGAGETTSGLLAVHLADRKRSLVSEQGHGDWTGFAMVLDPDTHQLYAGLSGVNGAGASVVALDTRTSERTTISDDSDNGGTIRWTAPTGLTLDAKGKRLFGVNFFFLNPNSLLAIDIADGTQSVVSDASKGAGIAWTAPFDVAWEPASSRVMIANPALPAIVAVDPASGDRTAFSGGPAGDGDAFTRPVSLAIDAANQRLLVVDMTQVVAVDLDTGNRTPFSGPGAGSGPDFVGPSRVVVDPIGKRAIVLDIGSTNPPVPPTLVEVALDDGTRSVLANLPERWFQGISLQFLEPAFAFDGATEIAYVAQLYAFDVTTGESISIAGHAK
jgi:DNA-binding beta-propeller fold protein YncE